MKVTKGYKTNRAAASFVDVISQSMKDSLVKDLLSANYHSLLTDGSADASILEQEVIYVFFLSKKGEPVIKFFNIQTPDHAHAGTLKKCIETTFHSISTVSMYQRLANLNIDSASINTGVHGGLGGKMKESASWINVIHCFNHSLELAVKDIFHKTFFKEVNNMPLKLYYLYRKSPKPLRELKMFSKMHDHSISKLCKSYGTRWIAHKVKAMEIVLNNYEVYIKHLESLAHTDSQALK